MNSEWRTLKLGQLGRIVTGKTPKTSDPNNFGGAIPFVTPTDMDGRKVIKQTGRCLTDLGASTVKNSLVPAGSIMVSCIGSDMGKSVIAGRQCVTNQQINTIVVDKEFCNEFVYYNLSIRKAELQHLAAGGSTMPILNKSVFSEIKIELPSIATQHEIVSVLGCVDEKITLLRETNVTLEAIAHALFKSWFVDFEPVRAKMEGRVPEGMDEDTAALFPDGLEESELGRVPRGWRVLQFKQLCNISSGKRPEERSDTQNSGAPVPLYGGAGIMGFTSRPLFDVPKIVTGRVGTLGKVHIAYPPFWASDNVLVVTPIDEQHFHFCFHWLNSIDVNALNRGSTQPLLTQKDLGSQEHVVSSLPLLELFAAVVGPIYQKIRRNVEQIHTLTTLRDTLLPRLISGQLRLSDIEDQISAVAT